MNTVVFEHVPIADLPAAWQAKLHAAQATRVTVRIEAETETDSQSMAALGDNPLFGLWRDREDMRDVAAYVREERSPRKVPDNAPIKR